MRLSRNRMWGNPALIRLIERLAKEAKAEDGWNGLLVGDLSQPRGGPMLTGHASHQVGLDADIWLTPMPGHTLSRKDRESLSATNVIIDNKTIDPKVWTDAHARLIKRAASFPEVARIFVHPPIKKALCGWAKGNRSWLGKVRPYYGHTYHFHIRMNCPAGSTDCKNQPAPHPNGRHRLRRRTGPLAVAETLGAAADRAIPQAPKPKPRSAPDAVGTSLRLPRPRQYPVAPGLTALQYAPFRHTVLLRFSLGAISRPRHLKVASGGAHAPTDSP